MYSQEQLVRYQEIYKEKFGKEISTQAAIVELNALLTLVTAVHKLYWERQEDFPL